MLKINENKLVAISVIGEIHSPAMGSPYRISADGEVKVFPGIGGIAYNVRIGDNACGWQADHVEPGVTIKNSNDSANGALNILSCIGNTATVLNGEAKGEKGFVTGKHGGCEHVLIDFEPEVKEKLAIGDKIQIKAFGTGLELLEYPQVKVFNIAPELLNKLGIKEKDGALEVSVSHLVPAKVMGSGIGKDNVYRGDYDIQLFDEKVIKDYNLGTLKLGSVVALTDADNTYGRIYREGSISIGIVVHTDSVVAGHGPGVTTILSSKDSLIKPLVDEKANLYDYLLR